MWNECVESSKDLHNCCVHKNVLIFWLLLFLDVLVSQQPHESVSAIHAAISNYLKMAPFREGGAGKGCQLPPDDCEEECDEEGTQDLGSQNDNTESDCQGDLQDVESDSSHSVQ
jgi:hypothetical protein